MLEVKDIVNICTTERIDTLIVITHNTDTTMCLSQLADDTNLCIVCVLILVYQDIFKLLAILLSNLFVITEEQEGIKQNIVKVHCICLTTSCFVCFVNHVDCRHTCTTVTLNSSTVFCIFCSRNKMILCH